MTTIKLKWEGPLIAIIIIVAMPASPDTYYRPPPVHALSQGHTLFICSVELSRSQGKKVSCSLSYCLA